MHSKTERNLTPAIAASYFLTMLVPQYRKKMNVRTNREPRTLCKALVATGNAESAGDLLAQRIKSMELYSRPGVEPGSTSGIDPSQGSEPRGKGRDADGNQGTSHRSEDAAPDSRAAVALVPHAEGRPIGEGERKRKRHWQQIT